MNRKRTKIIIETERLFIISSPTSRAINLCAWCGEQVRVVTVEDAAILANKSLTAIRREIEAQNLHSTEVEDGQLLICLNSIMQLK